MIKNKMIQSWIVRNKYMLLFIIILTLFNSFIYTILPIFLSNFLDLLINSNSYKQITFIIVIYIFLNIVSFLLSYIVEKFCIINGWNLIESIREKIVRHIFQMEISFFTDHTDGEILEIVEEDINNLQNFVSVIVNIINSLLLILLTIIIYFLIFPTLGIVEVIFVIISIILLYKNKKNGQNVQMTSRSYSSKFFGFISEVLHNYNDSTIINSYEFIISKLISIAQKWLPISIRANLVLWSSFILILILQVIGYGMTLILGGILWVNNLISVGTIYLLYNYTKNIFEPISNIQNQMKILQLLSASFQKIDRLVNIPIERVNENMIDRDSIKSIKMDNVSFNYRKGNLILKNCNLEILKGDSIAIIGKTGLGKSTIGNLLTGLYNVNSGDIIIGTSSIRDISLKGLRKYVLFIPQDNYLFETTLKNNITLFDEKIEDQTVLNAIYELKLENWFSHFNNDLNIKIKDLDVSCSNGYFKMIPIIRAFICNPEIIIFDEITAGLDKGAKKEIIRCIKVLMESKTIVIITHDNELFNIVDRIYTLNSNKLELISECK